MHPIHKITTFPYKSHILGASNTGYTGSNGPITVEDDVWICYGATILSGVKIGRGSVIAAKSIVSKDIPPYSIVINGKVRKQRFSQTVIDKMKDIDLSLIRKIEDSDVMNRILDSDITDENIDVILSGLR